MISEKMGYPVVQFEAHSERSPELRRFYRELFG